MLLLKLEFELRSPFIFKLVMLFDVKFDLADRLLIEDELDEFRNLRYEYEFFI